MKQQVRVSQDTCNGCMHIGNLKGCMAEELECECYNIDGSQVHYIIVETGENDASDQTP